MAREPVAQQWALETQPDWDAAVKGDSALRVPSGLRQLQDGGSGGCGLVALPTHREHHPGAAQRDSSREMRHGPGHGATHDDAPQ
eukprot:2243227-Pyramimonas_sp.AAC.1